MNIVVFGLGYVGLSNAVLLAQKHHVDAVDVIDEKVNLVNEKKSPIQDPELESFLKNKQLNLRATKEWHEPVQKADLIIIATPTNYDEDRRYFDTSIVDNVVAQVRALNETVTIVIKSTVPVGYTNSLIDKGYKNIVFVPEFLREGKALHDNLFPSRIIVGDRSDRGMKIAELFASCSENSSTPILLTNSIEAEAIKLFANTYLAMRVAYFNELDTYALLKGLDTKSIIEGVGLDPRIGTHYCNPSFGYGGYCLPKDTKQLLANYEGIPSALIHAIVESNAVRKCAIAERVKSLQPKIVGIYRLVMKAGSDNFRSAAIFDVINELLQAEVEVVIYEPTLGKVAHYFGCNVVQNFDDFATRSDVILANRTSSELQKYSHKVFSRDIFGNE